MSVFICTSDMILKSNVKGKVFTTLKRALFYLPAVGRSRLYRGTLENPQGGLKLLKYKTREYAQKVCDQINSAHGDDFKVEEVNL